MKKKKIRKMSQDLIVLLFVMTITAALTACGGGGGGGGATSNGPAFLALSSNGTGTFTDPANDASFDYMDITGATVAVTANDITCTMTLKNLPATLTFNKSSVPLNYSEYMWQFDFDTNNDGVPEYNIGVEHVKYTNTEFVGTVSTNVTADVWKYTSPTDLISIAPITVSINGNTFTLTIAKSVSAELSNITTNARVKIYNNVYNTTVAYADYI